MKEYLLPWLGSGLALASAVFFLATTDDLRRAPSAPASDRPSYGQPTARPAGEGEGLPQAMPAAATPAVRAT